MQRRVGGLILAGAAVAALATAQVAAADPDYYTGAEFSDPRGATVAHCSEGAYADVDGTHGVIVKTPLAKQAEAEGASSAEVIPLLRGGYALNYSSAVFRDPRQACTFGFLPR